MIATVYRIVLRTQATKGRLAALGLLGAVGMVVAFSIGLSDPVDPLDAGTKFVNSFCLSVYAPVVVLVFAAAALGDPAEDGTLVYLWLRPVARWRIVAGAVLATLTVTAPIVLGVSVLSAMLTGGGSSLVKGTLTSTLVAVAGYCGVFTLLGLLVKRALVWGLAYILLWEGFVAAAGAGAARLAVRAYTRSLLSDATGIPLRLADFPVVSSVLVPVLVSLAALALTVGRLRRTEVA